MAHDPVTAMEIPADWKQMSDAEQKDFVRAALQRIGQKSGLIDAAKDARRSAPASDD